MNSFIKASLIILTISVFACRPSVTYDPQAHVPAAQQEQFLYSIGRYAAKLPKRANHEVKFDAKYDAYYREEMKKYRLEKYHVLPDGTHYFMISRPAPSLYEKRVAIGGRLRYDEAGDIAEYEEVFRTWRLKTDELNRKSEVLFATLVETGNVNAYLPDQTEDEWVEFPDGKSYFDVASRRWKFQGQNDSLNYITF
jgi:hypothetical protein